MSKERLIELSKLNGGVVVEIDNFNYRLSLLFAGDNLEERNDGLYMALYIPTNFRKTWKKIEKIKKVCVKLKKKDL